MKRFLLAAVSLAVLLTACAQATPTVDPAQVQASAIAAASTMIAQTQAAMPTATPVPPTPLPSPTPFPSPTLGVLPTLASPTSLSSSGTDDCNHLLDAGASGPQAKVLIKNNTRGPVTFTVGISRINAFGQCGYLSWANIPKNNSITVAIPYARLNQGDPCYWAYAWVNDPRQQTTVSAGGFCINNSDKWTFDISYDNIKLTPP